MTTALDVITKAAQKLGVAAEGEPLSATMANDGLEALNLMLDSWSTERLSIFATQDQVVTWPADTASRTIGPTGDLIGNRPLTLDDSSYFKDPTSGVSYPLTIINQNQYNAIALKTATSTYPQVIWLNMDMPNASMTVYPVPTRDLEFHLVSVAELSKPATLPTVLVSPPGYLRAIIYNLACEFAPDFGVEPSATVSRIAMVSKRNLMSQNNQNDVMSMPAGMMGRRGRFNIFSGNY